jgi:hypothetical protein
MTKEQDALYFLGFTVFCVICGHFFPTETWVFLGAIAVRKFQK